jgi:hypothetical protein
MFDLSGISVADPGPGGPKTYGSYGFGSAAQSGMKKTFLVAVLVLSGFGWFLSFVYTGVPY